MEYIERDALLKKQQMDADIFKGSTLRTDIARRDEALNAVANIVNAPAADVSPVVRCKDCLYGSENGFICGNVHGLQYAFPNAFCSNGTKRE